MSHQDKFKSGYSPETEGKYVFRAGVKEMLKKIYEEDVSNFKKTKIDREEFIEKWIKTI
jgi:hypothetical protein